MTTAETTLTMREIFETYSRVQIFAWRSAQIADPPIERKHYFNSIAAGTKPSYAAHVRFCEARRIINEAKRLPAWLERELCRWADPYGDRLGVALAKLRRQPPPSARKLSWARAKAQLACASGNLRRAQTQYARCAAATARAELRLAA